jgi:hypothetical protein
VKKLLLFALGVIVVTGTAMPAIVGSAASLAAAPGLLNANLMRTPTVGPIVAEGTLVDANGNPVAGDVGALAMPNEQLARVLNRTLKPGDPITTPTVGWAAASSDGAFALRIDPLLIPSGYRSLAGFVNLELIGWNASSEGEWLLPASMPGALSRTMTVPAARVVRSVTLRLKQPVVAPPARRTRPGSPTVCSWLFNASYTAWDEVGESQPFLSLSGFSINTSQSNSLGTAASSNNGTKGSWSADGSASNSSGVSTSSSQNDWNRFYEIQSLYWKLRLSCAPWDFLTQPEYPTGGYTWVSTAFVDWGSRYCTPEGSGTTWKHDTGDGYSFSLGGGVLAASILGINLSLNSSYSSDRQVTYYFPSASALEGSNDYPSRASRINENPYCG